jgi:hypothetical protein
MKKWKRYLMLVLVTVTVISGVFLYSKLSIKKNVSLLSNTVEEKVLKLLEMSTVKYNYTNVVAYKDNKQLNGFNMPFSNKSFLIKYSGYIKAGVDLNTIETNVKDKKTVELILDKPTVFDNVIAEEDVYIYDERDSVFNKLSFKDLYEVLIEEKKNMEKEIIEKGLLNDAEKNAREILDSLLEGMGFENIEIKFR